MNIKIGTKIKALRKRDDITQERLADALGVTSQAISRWESESGYPDIEYITPIANFFNVTTDHLFDHDMAEKRRKIEDYIKQFTKYQQEKTSDEQIDLMRHALAEFPAEEKLLLKLAEALYWKWSSNGFWGSGENHEPDIEKHKSFGSWEEATKIMEELLTSSTDDIIRAQCRLMLATIYGAIGEKEKLNKIAEQCSPLYYSKEHVLSKAAWGEDKIKSNQNLLSFFPHILQNILIVFPLHTDTQMQIEANDFCIKFWEFIYRGDYGTLNSQLVLLYNDRATLLCNSNPEEAVKAFAKSFAHAKKHDTLAGEEGEETLTSLYLNRIKYNKNHFGAPICVRKLLEIMKREKYQTLHKNAEFIALINEVEAWLA